MDFTAVLTIAGPTALLALGAAWGGAKSALNGTRERVKTVELQIEKLDAENRSTRLEMIQATTRIETKLDFIMEQDRR